MKKNGGKLLSLSLAAGLVLCGGALAGCSSDGGYTLDTPGDVYSFAAATSAAMLSGGAARSADGGQIAVGLNKYIIVPECVVGRQTPTVAEADADSEFSSVMTMSYKTLGGETVECELLYSETSDGGSSALRGEITANGSVYTVTGETALIDGGGTAVSVVTANGDDKIEFSCLTTDGGQQISYGIYDDGALADEMSMTLSISDGKTILDMETEIMGAEARFSMTCDKNAGSFDIACEIGGLSGSINVSVSDGAYKYTVNGVSSDSDRCFGFNLDSAA